LASYIDQVRPHWTELGRPQCVVCVPCVGLPDVWSKLNIIVQLSQLLGIVRSSIDLSTSSYPENPYFVIWEN